MTKLLGVAAAMLVLAGCNKLRLGYEYADWLVIYSVEDNFDLDKAQRNRLKEDVDGYFLWHRKQMLPLYAQVLDRVADSLKVGFRPDGADSGYLEYQNLYRKTLEPVVDKALVLLTSLSDAQVEQWAEKQKKKHQKLQKDFSGSRDEQLERRYKKTLDELEDWTGRLTPVQRKEVRRLSRDLPWNGHLWLETRERKMATLEGLLRRKAPREELRKFLTDYYLYPERLRTPAYHAAYQVQEIKIKAMAQRIYAILTPGQKKHFIQQVRNLAHDLREMSKRE